MIFEEEDPGPYSKLQYFKPGQLDHPRIRVSISTNDNKGELPRFTINIEGEPVCVLFKAQKGDADVSNEAKRIWEFLLEWVSIWAGIKYPHAGRPLENEGFDIAYLRDRGGLKWKDIAESLYPGLEGAIDRAKKSYKQYWKKHSEECRNLPPL